MNKLFLEEKYLKILTEIFDKYCPNATVIAYGSRIKNEAHSGSDLDLAIIDFDEETEDYSLFDIRQAIHDSNIPFLVDIFILDTLPESFQKEIKKENIVIY